MFTSLNISFALLGQIEKLFLDSGYYELENSLKQTRDAWNVIYLVSVCHGVGESWSQRRCEAQFSHNWELKTILSWCGLIFSPWCGLKSCQALNSKNRKIISLPKDSNFISSQAWIYISLWQSLKKVDSRVIYQQPHRHHRWEYEDKTTCLCVWLCKYEMFNFDTWVKFSLIRSLLRDFLTKALFHCLRTSSALHTDMMLDIHTYV